MNQLVNEYIKACSHKIDKYIEELCAQNIANTDVLSQAMAYSLTAGGKRLRPILLIATAELFGKNGVNYIQTATALEFIHTYSLIHDDLPAMDNDDYRRGKLTNHKVFGDGMAILAGDALLTMAFNLMVTDSNVAPLDRLRIIEEISYSAGPYGMVGGQAIDLDSEDKHISLDELKFMHAAKTGALFEAALRCGAIIGGANEFELEKITTYAKAFGLVFQITDDILDKVGDEQIIGKPVGSDEKNHKSTYVTLTSLEEARKLARKAADEGLEAINSFGDKAVFLKELLNYLINRDK